MAAVIVHERTHLEQLHHLVRLAFRAWHSAIPWFPIANRAERAVATLTELLADDGARRSEGADALRRALERVGDTGGSGYPAAASGANPDADVLAARLDRLSPGTAAAPAGADPRTVRTTALAASVALVSLPIVAFAVILGIVP